MLSGKTPSVGKLDRRITIMEPVIEDGVSNEDKITAYTPVENDPRPWAEVVNATGDTDVINNQVTHVQNTTFTVRYRTDVTVKNRIVTDDDKMYTVLSAIPVGDIRRRFTKISGEYLKEYVIT